MTPQELKNSILQLAIQGRLVEQRPEEGTAEELYRQIQREKAALVKAGRIKKEKPLPEITEEEVPFEIPEGWKWVRVREYCIDVFSGKSPVYSKEKTPYLVIGQAANQQAGLDMEQVKYTVQTFWEAMDQRYFLRPYDVILNTLGNGTLGRSGIITEIHEPLLTDGHLFVFRQLNRIMSFYLYYYMQYKRKEIEKSANGSTNQTFLNLKGTFNWLVPMPPLAEQKRIVAKIEKLLPYIDRYEVAWSRLEDFNKRFPTDMQKSILQLAIQGKLVPQRPEEGTGEALYQQIQNEKRFLIRSGKLKKEKPLPEITLDEIPFDIPESWKWVHLNDVSFIIGDIDHKMPEKISGKGIPYISPLDFTPQGIDYDRAKQISLEDYELLGKKIKPEQDDIIFPRYGTIGVVRMVDTDRPFLVSYSCCTIKNMLRYMYPKYIFYVLKSPMIQDEINKYINKTTQPNVGLASIKRFLFPLPSLAEQKRIVAKLEELLPMCNNLM